MEKYFEFDFHLMNDKKPSDYFNEANKTELFEKIYPYTLIGDLKNVPQSPKYHPEGNVWNHTMFVINNAAKRKELSESPRALCGLLCYMIWVKRPQLRCEMEK